MALACAAVARAGAADTPSAAAAGTAPVATAGTCSSARSPAVSGEAVRIGEGDAIAAEGPNEGEGGVSRRRGVALDDSAGDRDGVVDLLAGANSVVSRRSLRLRKPPSVLLVSSPAAAPPWPAALWTLTREEGRNKRSLAALTPATRPASRPLSPPLRATTGFPVLREVAMSGDGSCSGDGAGDGRSIGLMEGESGVFGTARRSGVGVKCCVSVGGSFVSVITILEGIAASGEKIAGDAGGAAFLVGGSG